MTDLTLSVTISRDDLSLDPLELNDHLNYRVAVLLGGQLSWNRTTVSATDLDGELTVKRERQNVSEQVALDVFGADMDEAEANRAAAVAAFSQDRYTLTATWDGYVNTYDFEAADYKVTYTGPRVIARQLYLEFTCARQPLALAGGF